jgi:hypothetical protein
LDLAVELQKYISLRDLKKLPGIEEKTEEVKERAQVMFSKIRGNLEDMKRESVEKMKREVETSKREWEKEYNEEHVSNAEVCRFKLKLPSIKCFEESKEKKNVESERVHEEVEEGLMEYYGGQLKKHSLELNKKSLEFLIARVLQGKKMKLKSVYRLSKKSKKFEAQKFVNESKDKKNLLILCVSEQGMEFGGMAKSGWNSDDPINGNMLFSLTKGTLHPQLRKMDSDNALSILPGAGPCFGKRDLVISDNCCKEAGSSSSLGDVFEYKGDPKLKETYLGGASKFKLRDCLIYEVKGEVD